MFDSLKRAVGLYPQMGRSFPTYRAIADGIIVTADRATVCPCGRSRPHDSDRNHDGRQKHASGLHHSSVSNLHDPSSQIIV